MSKDPAFLFYPNDYIGGTMGMTFEEKGAYMELLMMQFNRGHMTSHMIGQTVGQLWDTIKVKFLQDDKGLWYNVRLEEEQNKRKTFTESRRNNVSGKNQYTNKPKKQSGHMTSHMENEDENVIEVKKESKDKNKIPSVEEFKKYAIEKKPSIDVHALKLKYEAWVINDWKDGNNNPIKNWKVKLLNTIPYINETKAGESKGTNLGADPLPKGYGESSSTAIQRGEYLESKEK